jgi:hypothetical protein
MTLSGHLRRALVFCNTRIRSPCLLTEGKTAKFEVIFDEKLSEQRSLHEVNEQRREIFHQKAPKISG